MSPLAQPALWTPIARASLPPVNRVLTAPDGAIHWSADDRLSCGLIELTDAVTAIVAVDPDHEAVSVLIHEARMSGHAVSLHYLVDADTLATLHSPNRIVVARRGKTEAVEKRSERDDEIEALFAEAHKLRATDIHFLAESATGTIKFRVHGDFVHYKNLPLPHFNSFCHAIYLRSDSSTKLADWHPQNLQEASGAVRLRTTGQLHRFRYQSFDAAPDGYKIVIRVLDDSLAVAGKGFPALGYTSEQIGGLTAILNKPRGVILLSGPINSGKSTTLVESYQYLKQRNGRDYNIHTVEHPVEYRVPGITQSNVRYTRLEDAGPAWARALAALMRMDVNCIGIGEIRDGACAEISMQLVDTGHKLLASIHGGDPFDAAKRFTTWGCHPENVWDDRFLSGVVTQNLLPVVCPHCATPYRAADIGEPMRRAIDKIAGDRSTDAIRVTGPGCEACKGLGRIGRTVVAEILNPTPELMQIALIKGWRAAHNLWARQGTGNPHGAPYGCIHHAIDKMLAGLICPIKIDHKILPLGTHAREITTGHNMRLVAR